MLLVYIFLSSFCGRTHAAGRRVSCSLSLYITTRPLYALIKFPTFHVYKTTRIHLKLENIFSPTYPQSTDPSKLNAQLHAAYISQSRDKVYHRTTRKNSHNKITVFLVLLPSKSLLKKVQNMCKSYSEITPILLRNARCLLNGSFQRR